MSRHPPLTAPHLTTPRDRTGAGLRSRKMPRRALFKALAGLALLGGSRIVPARAAQRLVFWNALFDSALYREHFLPWWEAQLASLLAQAGLEVDYGVFAYPDLRQRFLISARTGRPDLIEGVLSHVPTYQAADLLEPLSEPFAAWEESEAFLPSTLEAVRFRGALWGLPYVGNARALVYRRSLLDKHGLRPPTTWDELIETARALNAAEPGVAGYMMTTKPGLVRVFQEFLSHLFQLTERLFLPEGDRWQVNVGPEELAQVLGLYRALFRGDPPVISPLARGKEALVMDAEYAAGQIAMMPNGPFIFARRILGPLQREVLEEDTGVAPLPRPPGGTQATFLEVKSVMINRFSALKAPAWRIAQLWCSREGIAHHVSLTGDLPARQDVRDRLPELLDPASLAWQAQWEAIFPSGRALDPVPQEQVQRAIDEAVQGAIYADEPLTSLAEALHAQLERAASTFAAFSS